MTNRDKINKLDNSELADILNETDKYNACKYCYHKNALVKFVLRG